MRISQSHRQDAQQASMMDFRAWVATHSSTVSNTQRQTSASSSIPPASSNNLSQQPYPNHIQPRQSTSAYVQQNGIASYESNLKVTEPSQMQQQQYSNTYRLRPPPPAKQSYVPNQRYNNSYNRKYYNNLNAQTQSSAHPSSSPPMHPNLERRSSWDGSLTSPPISLPGAEPRVLSSSVDISYQSHCWIDDNCPQWQDYHAFRRQPFQLTS